MKAETLNDESDTTPARAAVVIIHHSTFRLHRFFPCAR
jgi:hypothetical protein